MIKINKDFNDIPESLKPATKDFFPTSIIPTTSKNTHNVRERMAQLNEYTPEADKRYKYKDIKDSLVNIYGYKCAYCGIHLPKSMLHVEHFRPKGKYPPKDGSNTGKHQPHSGYYWISLSWGNLLLACSDCNNYKGSIFDIEKEQDRATYKEADHKNWKLIHQLSVQYDIQEKPFMINPEKEDPAQHFSFTKEGHLNGVTAQGKYTILVCKLDRADLVEARATIIKHFQSAINNLVAEHKDNCRSFLKSAKAQIKTFMDETSECKTPFIAFRERAIEDNWLKNIIVDTIKKYYMR